MQPKRAAAGNSVEKMEAAAGIEPAYSVLQTDA